jgi:hypothetical protein
LDQNIYVFWCGEVNNYWRVLSSVVSTVLLVIGEVEQIPGPAGEGKMAMQLVYAG